MERKTEYRVESADEFLRAFLDEPPKLIKPKWKRNGLSFTNTDPKDIEQMRLRALEILAPLIAERKIAKMKALKDDHDALGSKTSVLQGQDTEDADVKERQAKGMQGPEHPHSSGDETGKKQTSSSNSSILIVLTDLKEYLSPAQIMNRLQKLAY